MSYFCQNFGIVVLLRLWNDFDNYYLKQLFCQSMTFNIKPIIKQGTAQNQIYYTSEMISSPMEF